MNRLRYLDHFRDTRDFLLQRFLNAHLERHRGHGAGAARAFQPHLNDTVLFHAHEFNIAAVSLEHRPDFFEGLDYFFFHGVFSFLFFSGLSDFHCPYYTLFYSSFAEISMIEIIRIEIPADASILLSSRTISAKLLPRFRTMNYLIIGVGGFIGAIARYVLAVWIGERWGRSFPLGTLIINVSGSFLIGLLMVLFTERFLINPQWRLLLVVGFLGAYTTFSTFEYETGALLTDGEWLLAMLNVVLSVLVGFIALKLGEIIAKSI